MPSKSLLLRSLLYLKTMPVPVRFVIRDAVALARNRLSNAWSPGYEASCKAAGYAFFPITLNEFGGHGTSGSEWLRVIAHEGDGAMLGKKCDLGERFYHEHRPPIGANTTGSFGLSKNGEE
jgi:hypothetical protein